MTSPHTPPTGSPDPEPTPDPIRHEFIAAGPIDANIQNLRGTITVRAEHGTRVGVELIPRGEAGAQLATRMRVRFDAERLTVDAPADEAHRVGVGLGDLFSVRGRGGSLPFTDRLAESFRSAVRGVEGLLGGLEIRVVLPAGSRVVVSDGVGDLEITGSLARLEARTGTGDLHVRNAAEESTRLTTGTGDVTLGEATGQVHATTGTGDLRLDRLEGTATLSAGVGGVTVREARSGSLTARSGLGDVELRVAAGTAVHLDLATGLGEQDVRLTPADGAGAAERTLEVHARSGKGDLRVLRAGAAAAAS